MKFVAMTACLFLLAPALAAQTPDAKSAEKTAPAAKTAPKDRIVCRSVEVTGSLVKRGKVCKTAGEWNAITRNGNENARAVVDSGLICSGCRGN